MIYRAIGLMSGSSLDGLDIVFAEIQENAGAWTFEIIAADCYPYSTEWLHKLQTATSLPAKDYCLLDAEYGHYIGTEVNRFIEAHQLQFRVALIASHGHTTFHLPSKKMTAQIGNGAAIAAETQLPVISDLRALDVAFGGQGAPIVPIGEKLLFPEYPYLINLGGIANLSIAVDGAYQAFDVCPANRVLNLLAGQLGKEFDMNGEIAATGKVDPALLQALNALEYYKLPPPKSLANDFGTGIIYPIIQNTTIPVADKLRTYVEHVALQLAASLQMTGTTRVDGRSSRVLITGGGAFNGFLITRITELFEPLQLEVVIPDEKIISYKEALIMALIGVLRWRQEYNVLSTVTGASRDSVGGAIWMGQEA